MKTKYFLKELGIPEQKVRESVKKVAEENLNSITDNIIDFLKTEYPKQYQKYYENDKEFFGKKIETFFNHISNGNYNDIESIFTDHRHYTNREIILKVLVELSNEVCNYIDEQKTANRIRWLFFSIILSVIRNESIEKEIDSISFLPSKKTLMSNFDNLKISANTISLLDIRNFKDFNIYYGFETGNTIIFQIGKLLKEEFHTDLVVRFQNDEFFIISKSDTREIKNKIENFKKTVNKKMKIVVKNIFQKPVIKFETVILDISKYKNLDFDTTTWILYKGLDESRKVNNNLKIIHSNTIAPYILQKKLHIEVMEALKNQNIIVAFQPVKNIFSDEILFKESLVRIKTNQTTLNAYQFIETIQSKKTEEEIDKAAVNYCFSFLNSGKIYHKVSVNLSAQFMENCFDWFLNKITESDINPENIIIELTERDDILKIDKIEKKLLSLKKRKFTVFIDDFGVKYANYEIIRELPIDGIKIDGAIVRNIVKNELDSMFISHVIDIAKLKNKKVVAEFVESTQILNKLKEIGMEKQFNHIYGQGFLLGKPEIAK